jgi:hypothetical protein
LRRLLRRLASGPRSTGFRHPHIRDCRCGASGHERGRGHFWRRKSLCFDLAEIFLHHSGVVSRKCCRAVAAATPRGNKEDARAYETPNYPMVRRTFKLPSYPDLVIELVRVRSVSSNFAASRLRDRFASHGYPIDEAAAKFATIRSGPTTSEGK